MVQQEARVLATACQAAEGLSRRQLDAIGGRPHESGGDEKCIHGRKKVIHRHSCGVSNREPSIHTSTAGSAAGS